MYVGSVATVRPLRILAIAPTSFFADYGCHVRIRGQMTALSSRGHEILLVTYPSGRDVDGIATCRMPWPKGSPIQVGSSRLKIALDAVLGPTALVASTRFRPDIIHAFLHEGALIGSAVRSLRRCPMVFDFQGSLTGEMLDHHFIAPGSAWLRPLRALETRIDRLPDAIAASSRHATESLHAALQTMGSGRPWVQTLPDSVDPDRFRPRDRFSPEELSTLRCKLGIPADRRIVVYLGLLAPYQGTDLLLQAVARLLTSVPNAHLLVMGFPFVEKYRRLAETLSIADHVTFTSGVPYETAPVHLALGEIAVAPKLSATEGSGKLLPYMATALPIAAFDTPVHREYLSGNAAYASPGDSDGLASAMVKLMQDPIGARETGHSLREIAVRDYTWDRAADSLEAVYERVLRKYRPVLKS